MLFGTSVDSTRPLWRKIERQAAAREAQKLAAGKAAKAARLAPLREARRRHRARVARRELVNHRLAQALRDASRPDRIINEVAAKHRMARGDIISPRKFHRHVEARQELCWRLYSETTLSTAQIAQRVGRRDHTTVLHAVGAWMRRHHLELPAQRLEARLRWGPNA